MHTGSHLEMALLLCFPSLRDTGVSLGALGLGGWRLDLWVGVWDCQLRISGLKSGFHGSKLKGSGHKRVLGLRV